MSADEIDAIAKSKGPPLIGRPFLRQAADPPQLSRNLTLPGAKSDIPLRAMSDLRESADIPPAGQALPIPIHWIIPKIIVRGLFRACAPQLQACQ